VFRVSQPFAYFAIKNIKKRPRNAQPGRAAEGTGHAALPVVSGPGWQRSGTGGRPQPRTTAPTARADRAPEQTRAKI